MPRRQIYETDADRQRAYRKRKKAARLTIHFQSLLDVRATPQELFDSLNREFDFETDVCALPYNAKCARFFTPEVNGLSQEWQGSCFMNPPYGREMGAWMKKAYDSARDNGATVVCVIPSRTDVTWWHEYVMRSSEVRFLKGRVIFGGSENPAPFPTAIVIFRPGEENTRFVGWVYNESKLTKSSLSENTFLRREMTGKQKEALPTEMFIGEFPSVEDLFGWCLNCERVWPNEIWTRSEDECPGCGAALYERWPWTKVRAVNPDYPETPEEGGSYPMYPPMSTVA